MSTLSPAGLRKCKQAADELGFMLVAPYELRCASGVNVVYAALLPEFGSKRGMLVIVARDHAEAMRVAQEQQFGFSVLSDDPTYDRDSFVEMLCDWGWTSEQPRPAWYAEPTSLADEDCT